MAFVNSSKNDLHDKHCWECHVADPTVFCSLCPRAVHSRCISLPDETVISTEAVVWRCPFCEHKMERQEQINPQLLSAALIIAINGLKKGAVFTVFYEKYYKIVQGRLLDSPNPIDMSTLEQRVIHNEYFTVKSFLGDLLWIFHNSMICFRSERKMIYLVESWKLIFEREMIVIHGCIQCYLNYADEAKILNMCNKPHMIVWVRMLNFNVWPAKVLMIESNIAFCIFFGTHQLHKVPCGECYLVTEDKPRILEQTKAIEKAYLEMSVYAKVHATKFGPYPFRQDYIILTPTLYEDFNKNKGYGHTRR